MYSFIAFSAGYGLFILMCCKTLITHSLHGFAAAFTRETTSAQYIFNIILLNFLPCKTGSQTVSFLSKNFFSKGYYSYRKQFAF